jgi:hypothetical protein
MRIVATLATMQCVLWLADWLMTLHFARWLQRHHAHAIRSADDVIAFARATQFGQWSRAMYAVAHWYIVVPVALYKFIVILRRAKKARKDHGEEHRERER